MKVNGLFLYKIMTNNIREPRNGIDKGSYYHDFSNGSGVVWIGSSKNSDPRASNNAWVRNAWRNVHNPYDFAVALTGTVLFKTANVISDIGHMKPAKYKVKMCTKGCSFGGEFR